MNLTQAQIKAQAERLLSSVRRIRDTPAYQMELEQCRNRRKAFFAKMVYSEDAPTNSMGVSSTVQGTGAIATLDGLPLLPTKRRRKTLRAIVGELTGSQMDDLQPPTVAIRTPRRKPKAVKVRPTKPTEIIFNPTLKQ
jgi:hypothetical protein